MKRFLSLILVTALIFELFNPSLPSVNAAEIDSCFILETTDTANIRTGPSKNADLLNTLSAGELLYGVEYLTNEHGNKWVRINYFGSTGYIYGNNIKPHEHYFESDRDENGVSYEFCRCGEIKEEGVTQTFVPAAILGALTAEELMNIGITIAGTYLGYRILKNGLIHPIRISYSGFLEAISCDELKSMEDGSNNSDEDNGYRYYPAHIITKDNEDTIILRNFNLSMNCTEAVEYIRGRYLADTFELKLTEYQQDIHYFANIYTISQNGAESLCDEAVEKIPSLSYYGDDSGIPGAIASNTSCNVAATYEHYHLYDPFNKKSVIHILFGNPLGYIPTV